MITIKAKKSASQSPLSSPFFIAPPSSHRNSKSRALGIACNTREVEKFGRAQKGKILFQTASKSVTRLVCLILRFGGSPLIFFFFNFFGESELWLYAGQLAGVWGGSRMALFRQFFHWKPPDGPLEIAERVYGMQSFLLCIDFWLWTMGSDYGNWIGRV